MSLEKCLILIELEVFGINKVVKDYVLGTSNLETINVPIVRHINMMRVERTTVSCLGSLAGTMENEQWSARDSSWIDNVGINPRLKIWISFDIEWLIDIRWRLIGIRESSRTKMMSESRHQVVIERAENGGISGFYMVEGGIEIRLFESICEYRILSVSSVNLLGWSGRLNIVCTSKPVSVFTDVLINVEMITGTLIISVLTSECIKSSNTGIGKSLSLTKQNKAVVMGRSVCVELT